MWSGFLFLKGAIVVDCLLRNQTCILSWRKKKNMHAYWHEKPISLIFAISNAISSKLEKKIKRACSG